MPTLAYVRFSSVAHWQKPSKQTNKQDAGKNNRLGKRPVTKRANEINPFDSPVAKVSVKGRQTVWQTRLIQIQVQVHKAES